MAEVALRAYVKEIDALIERDQLDEAISHCRHILQSYPKHLDSYRLLGKSYLEAKRFGDSADIFQRVLSAVPDDFVSQIGMAIVREDEGNMDAAIWHMERAYETNPANPAIRQELSRLIGRRDGLEPHKIRLTRGALARQYAQGELYPQAIAELRSALQEDPDRPDLRVLLAKMYWQSDQWEEATETCERILLKLPFCLEANRIMAAILQAQDRNVDASDYHRKIAALDPYFAFVESAAMDPYAVDANTVKIEQYAWTPGQPLPSTEPSQPDWVSSLGVDLSEESKEKEESSESPPWLAGVESTPSVGDGATPALVGAAAMTMNNQPNSEDDQIPEWMQEAGWGPSSGEAEEGPVSFTDDELESLEAGAPPLSEEPGELAPADIPNWLQDIAPEPSEQEEELPSPTPAEEPEQPARGTGMPAWLSDIAADAEEVSPDPSPSQPEVTPAAEPSSAEGEPSLEGIDLPESPEVPTWVEDETPGATSTIITWLGDKPSQELEQPPTEQVPEWLEDTSPQAVLPAEDELPTWMRESTDQPAETADEAESSSTYEEMPSWIRDTERESPTLPETEYEFDPATEPKLKPSQEAPSWLAGVAAAASAVEPEEELEAEPAAPQAEARAEEMSAEDVADLFQRSEPTEETPAWLSGISASDVEAVAESPEWLSQLSDQQEGQEPDEMPAPSWVDEGEAIAEEPAAEAEAPDWLQGIGEGEGEASPVVEREVPDWLSGIAEPEPAEAPAGEWLDELRAATPADEPAPEAGPDEGRETPFDVDALRMASAAAVEHELSSDEPVGSAGAGEVPDVVDDDEVFNWLENLAESQETPEQAAPEMPPQPAISSPLEEGAAIADQAPPDEPDQGLDWLEDLASERSVEAEVVATEPATMPDFSAVEPATPSAVEGEEGETPGWLRDLADTPTDEPIVMEEPPAIPAQPPVVPPPIEEQPVAEPPESGVEVPDWLLEPIPEAPPAPPTRPIAPPPVVSEPPSPAPIEAPFETVGPRATEPTEPPPQPSPLAPEPPKVKYKEPPTDKSMLLQDARQALSAGDAGRAVSNYRKLIDRKHDLDTVIKDLEHASKRYPNLPTVWQALGDAYMKADRLPEAIEAYQRGIEVA